MRKPGKLHFEKVWAQNISIGFVILVNKTKSRQGPVQTLDSRVTKGGGISLQLANVLLKGDS